MFNLCTCGFTKFLKVFLVGPKMLFHCDFFSPLPNKGKMINSMIFFFYYDGNKLHFDIIA